MTDIQLYSATPSGPRPLPIPEGTVRVHELLRGLPPGVYSGLRTYRHDRFLRLDAHLARAEQSMALLGWSQRLDRGLLCGSLHEAVSRSPHPESLVLFVVLDRPAVELDPESRVLIALTPFAPIPERFLSEGVCLQIAPELRRERPLAKVAEFVIERMPYPLGTREAFEHLMLDEQGRILEGSSSNFFAVIGGALRTAPGGVLEGVTRRAVLEIAAGQGLEVEMLAATLEELDAAQEAFICSSSRELVPVIEVAGKRIGDGCPGPVYARLRGAFRELVEREARAAVTT